MDESVPRLSGIWPSFWHYPPLDSKSPKASGLPLVGGKGQPLFFTGECLSELTTVWVTNRYYVFLCNVDKVLIKENELWQLKIINIPNK